MKVSSDGDIEEWEEGLEHYIECVGNNDCNDDEERLLLKKMIEESFNKETEHVSRRD